MDSLWLHVIRQDRLERSLALPEQPLRVGSQEGADLVLSGEGVDPVAGILRRGRGGTPEFVPEGGGWPVALVPGQSMRLGPYTLAVQAIPRDAGAARRLVELLAEALPHLWDQESQEGSRALLEVVRIAFDAAWGAVLAPGAGGELAVRLVDGERAPGRGATVSRRVLARLAEAGEPVLVDDLGADPELAGAPSVHVATVNSVVAAALPGEDGQAGVLYLESPGRGRRFGDPDRELLGRVAGLLGELLARARQTRDLRRENRQLGALRVVAADGERAALEAMEATPGLKPVVEQLRQAAPADTTVLVLGESGAGKELVAGALHHLSRRSHGPLVPVHCMALPRDLVEAELFGHAKGAFSGADRDRPGRFELADGGTLFLDELGELSLEVQVKLLRVLEQRQVTRLGEGQPRPVDVRVVAATNADLEAMVARGSFREDLFYRLSVFVVDLPPLRARPEDVEPLARRFLEEFSRRMGRPSPGFTSAALGALAAHAWPGNVRELRNVIEQAVLRTSEGPVDEGVLRLGGGPRAAPVSGPASGTAPRAEDWPEDLDQARALFEGRHISRALQAEKGHAERTAARLGISRAALYRRMSALGLDPKTFR